MTPAFSPTSPASSSPPLSPDLSKDDSQPFHITVDRSSAITHPFPSPGSAFVPPPKPGVHEFTLPQTKRSKKNNNSASPSSTSAPGSGANTPNNASTSSIAQSSRSSTMMDVDSGPLSNGSAVPSGYKASVNESVAAAGSGPASQSSSSQPQPHSQLTSPSASSIPSASDTMATANNTVPSKTSSLSLGSGRATPTPSNATGYSTSNAGGHNTTATNSIPPIARTSSSSSTSSKQTQTALSSSRPAPPSPTPSRTPSQSRSGSRRQSRLSSASGSGASPNNSPMNTTTATNGTATPSKRLSTLSNLSVSSNPTQNKRLSTLSNVSTLPTVPQSQVAPSAMTPTTSAPALPSTTVPLGQILIRDFAFPVTDKRHTGEGADAPKVIKKMQKKYGPPGIRKPERGRDSTSASASSSCASSESGSRRGSGFGFGWGANAGGGLGGWWSGMFSGFGTGNRSGSGSRGSRVGSSGVQGDDDAFTPTLNDLTRNFNTSSSSPGASQPASPAVGPQTIDSYGEEDHYDDDDNNAAETPLLPGLYKALYDFIPEGTAEMGLREGDIVRVAGEGGGVGWAVVVRGTIRFTEDGEEIIDYAGGGGDASNNKRSTTNEPGARTDDMWALVPESYLEVWRLDRNDDDEGQLGDDEK